ESGDRTRTTYTPEVRARMREVDDLHPGATLGELALAYQDDHVLGSVRDEWTANAIADLRRRFRDEFPRRPSVPGGPPPPGRGISLDEGPWSTVRQAVLANLDKSYDEVASLLLADPAFAHDYPAFKGETVSSLVGKFDQAGELAEARAGQRNARWRRIRRELIA